MRTRIIITAIVVIGLALGVEGYIKAVQAFDLPQFTAGQVLKADELNTLVKALNDLEGQLVCNTEGSCNSDPALSDECQEYVDSCLTTQDPLGCIGAGTFICEEEELPDDVDETNVCDENVCLLGLEQRTRCEVFLASCLDNINIKERCVAGALFICTNPIKNEPGL